MAEINIKDIEELKIHIENLEKSRDNLTEFNSEFVKVIEFILDIQNSLKKKEITPNLSISIRKVFSFDPDIKIFQNNPHIRQILNNSEVSEYKSMIINDFDHTIHFPRHYENEARSLFFISRIIGEDVLFNELSHNMKDDKVYPIISYGSLNNDSILEIKDLSLNLSTLGYVPNEIQEFASVKNLSINGDANVKIANNGKIKGLITNILPNFKKLIELRFWDINLLEIPENIKDCDKLEKLTLANISNHFIPDCIFEIKSLVELDLGKGPSNNLKELNPKISNLANLIKLNLTNNPNIELPNSLFRCPIKELIMSNCQLYKIPKVIFNIKTLEKLDLGDNYIKIIDENLVNLSKLKELHFGSNLISTIPSIIGNMKNLNTLALGYNNISHIPVEISSIPIKEIYLSSNPIYDVPPFIFSIQDFRSISITGEHYDIQKQEYPYFRKIDFIPELNMEIKTIILHNCEYGSKWTIRFQRMDRNQQFELFKMKLYLKKPYEGTNHFLWGIFDIFVISKDCFKHVIEKSLTINEFKKYIEYMKSKWEKNINENLYDEMEKYKVFLTILFKEWINCAKILKRKIFPILEIIETSIEFENSLLCELSEWESYFSDSFKNSGYLKSH